MQVRFDDDSNETWKTKTAIIYLKKRKPPGHEDFGVREQKSSHISEMTLKKRYQGKLPR